MFNQKESGLLQDLKKSEQICIEKYRKYAGSASAPELKTLFQQLEQQEQQHLQTLNQIINSGAAPANSGGQQQSQSQSQQSQGQSQSPADYSHDQNGYQNDSYLCTDALSTEKHISADYNTSIFEFKDSAIRNTLNHIQKEEQQHGEQIYNYMAVNGMYS